VYLCFVGDSTLGETVAGSTPRSTTADNVEHGTEADKMISHSAGFANRHTVF